MATHGRTSEGERGEGKDDNIKKAYRNVRRKGLLAWRSCEACLHQRRPLLNSLFPFYLNPRRHLVTTSTSINYHWRPFALPRLCTQPDTPPPPQMCTLGTFTTCEFLHRWLLTSITISNETHCDARSNLHIDFGYRISQEMYMLFFHFKFFTRSRLFVLIYLRNSALLGEKRSRSLWENWRCVLER